MHKLKKDEIEQIITLYIYMFVIEIFFLILNNLIVLNYYLFIIIINKLN